MTFISEEWSKCKISNWANVKSSKLPLRSVLSWWKCTILHKFHRPSLLIEQYFEQQQQQQQQHNNNNNTPLFAWYTRWRWWTLLDFKAICHNSLEILKYISENSPSKGSFRGNKRKLEFSYLSFDSPYLQAVALKSMQSYISWIPLRDLMFGICPAGRKRINLR